MYWIMLRNSEDQDAEGYWRKMEKYSGPFEDEEEARDEAWDLNQKQKQHALEWTFPVFVESRNISLLCSPVPK